MEHFESLNQESSFTKTARWSRASGPSGQQSIGGTFLADAGTI
ncbi:hypothetical protein [Hymenobacter sp. AT01-02]|nr:hypothetical protein [Hymenobacter sp. AT01-02]